jgi:ribosomal protein S18 acetylase RimI-like enzyme
VSSYKCKISVGWHPKRGRATISGEVADEGAIRQHDDEQRMIRKATEGDVARIAAIARAAYVKYVPRIGREPPPMLADFAAEIAAGHVVVLEIAGTVKGYLISWPKTDAYFIDNIAVDPAHQGLGLGRQLIDYAVRDAKRHNLSALQLYTNVTMTENLAMYAHMGFVETHRVLETQFNIETGLPRIYMCRTLPVR